MKFEWKKVILYAIVPALIAGLFSIAPKLYDIAVEPKAELTYSSINGPELPVGNGAQRIISITVQNSGKRSLTNVISILTVEGGKIEAQKIQETSGLRLFPQVSEKEITLTLPKLHPDEKFVLSALVHSNGPGVSPRFTLRSDEVLGGLKEKAAEKNKEQIPFYGALLAGASVFVMSFLFLRQPKISEILGARKQDVIYYILARTGLPNLSDAMYLIDMDPTYFRTADVLLSYGQSSDPEKNEKALKGLMSLLLIEELAEITRSVVVQNIRALQGEKFNEERIADLGKNVVSAKEQILLREKINQLFDQTN